mmetsp:Transcript_5424/g.10350  ORF Transcript_5424/g.10350 Transcript_5424/m.10350 type:complete len:319 (-) Transcript_5424:205-1161(-)
MMSVHTVSRKSLSCDTTMSVFFQRCRYSSSQSTARRSRWLVGSSSSSSVGWMKSARASEMRMRQPPEKVLVVLVCIVGVKPKPCRILDARASAPSAFLAFSSSYTSTSRACAASWSMGLPSLPKTSNPSSGTSVAVNAIRFFSSSRSCTSSTSASTTALSAVRSSPITSCSTSSTSMYSGTGICRRASSRSSVDLPLPLGPTKPYLRPCTTLKVVFFISSLPLAITENPSTLMSRDMLSARSISSTCLASRTVNASSSSRIAAAFSSAIFISLIISFFCFFLASLSVSILVRSTSRRSVSSASTSISSSEGGRSMSPR